MKFLVCISTVPDTTAKIAFKDNNTKFASDGVTYIINPTDEWYALVRALELKEQLGGTVTVINVGPSTNEKFLRTALAIGADDAVLVETDEELEPYYVAKSIADYASANGYNYVVTGKETISYNSFSIGGMIAEFLDLPYVAQASKWDLSGDTSTIIREIEGGEETVEVKGNLVISAQKGMAEQRLPSMKGIMGAKSKPLTKVAAAKGEELVSLVRFEDPKPKAPCKMIDASDVETLVNLLRNEAKVI